MDSDTDTRPYYGLRNGKGDFFAVEHCLNRGSKPTFGKHNAEWHVFEAYHEAVFFVLGGVVCYTDGSCLQNGQSGYGVFFGPKYKLNTVRRLVGDQSSMRAELSAVIQARRITYEENTYEDHLLIRSDSKVGCIFAQAPTHYL